MSFSYKMRIHALAAALAGLALRFLFILKFPVNDAGDSPFYMDIAWNWLKHGVYGLVVNGRLVPVDMRVPGYPAFLAGIFALAGLSERTIMFAQAGLDMLTCFVIGLIAARLAPKPVSSRAALAAVWLAALCPFTANYTAAVLPETLAIFLTAVAILVLVEPERQNHKPGFHPFPLSSYFLGGIVVGLGTLVRPETPLLLLAAGLVLLARLWRPANWLRLVRTTTLMALGLALPLAPWAARNWRTLHEFQPLAPRYGQLPGEIVPRGFDAWTHTWLWRFRDAFSVSWNLDSARIELSDIPASAFDSPAQRSRVAQLLAAYNETTTLTPAEDRAFGEIARQRTELHPLRTRITVPTLRSLALWFAPRVELLPYTGRIFPISSEWENDREDFSVSAALILVNLAYLSLAAGGAWIAWKCSSARPAAALLLIFIMVRSAFIASFAETPEPRYVLECFPAVIALAASAWARFKSPQPVQDESSAGKFAESAPSRGLPAWLSSRGPRSPGVCRPWRSGTKPGCDAPRCAHAPRGNQRAARIPPARNLEIPAPRAIILSSLPRRRFPSQAAQYGCSRASPARWRSGFLLPVPWRAGVPRSGWHARPLPGGARRIAVRHIGVPRARVRACRGAARWPGWYRTDARRFARAVPHAPQRRRESFARYCARRRRSPHALAPGLLCAAR